MSHHEIKGHERDEDEETAFIHSPLQSHLPKWITESHTDHGFEPYCCGGPRHKVAEFVESRQIQILLLVLLIFDVTIVIAEIILEYFKRCQPLGHTDPPLYHLDFPDEWMHVISEILHMLSVVILSIFELELFLLLFAFGLGFFRKFMYILDLIVVSISLVVDIVLSEVLSSLLVLFRMWRMLRIVHGIYVSMEERGKEKLHASLRRIDQLNQENDRLKREVEKLTLGATF